MNMPLLESAFRLIYRLSEASRFRFICEKRAPDFFRQLHATAESAWKNEDLSKIDAESCFSGK
jgi:hypothetical protein